MVLVSIGLVIPTLLAARAAAYAVALESEPVILIEQSPPIMPLSVISAWYEFSFTIEPGEHEPQFREFRPVAGYNFTDTEAIYPDGRKNIYTNIRVRNLGRSPTIDLTLPLRITWLDIETKPSVDGFEVGTTEKSADLNVKIRAIGPQSDSVLAIINKTGKNFRVTSTGVALDTSPRGKHRRLSAFAPGQITIKESV